MIRSDIKYNGFHPFHASFRYKNTMDFMNFMIRSDIKYNEFHALLDSFRYKNIMDFMHYLTTRTATLLTELDSKFMFLLIILNTQDSGLLFQTAPISECC